MTQIIRPATPRSGLLFIDPSTAPYCYYGTDAKAWRGTLKTLQSCIAKRNAGQPVAFTTDSHWLVNMAINRRAGWPDDPSGFRGSCLPVGGRYPKKAEGLAMNHLRLIAGEVNSRVVVRYASLGEWRKLVAGRLPDRITMPGEE
jgi:hypothetical protein